MMKAHHQESEKHILLVEDHPALADCTLGAISDLGGGIKVTWAQNAADALGRLKRFVWGDPSHQFDAMIVKTRLPYGETDELDRQSDPDHRKTGIKILNWLRHQEKGSSGNSVFVPLWTAVVASCMENPFSIAPNAKLNDFDHFTADLPNNNGRIYVMPYDSLVFLSDLAHAIGVQNPVPQELLPEGYRPDRVVKPVKATVCSL